MRIVRATTINEVLECIPIEIGIRKKETGNFPLKDMLTFVSSQLDKPYFGFYIAYEEEKIIGFMILFIVPIKGMEQIQIWRIWSDPHYKEVMKEFFNITKQWAKETKIHKLTTNMETIRNKRNNIGRIKALKRRWGFHITGIQLERRI